MMSVLDLIARAQDLRTETVEVDGIHVRVREPSAAVHSSFAMHWGRGEVDAAHTLLLRHCVVDEDGVPCLSDDQAVALSRAGTSLVTPITQAIMRLMTRAAGDEKKA